MSLIQFLDIVLFEKVVDSREREREKGRGDTFGEVLGLASPGKNCGFKKYGMKNGAFGKQTYLGGEDIQENLREREREEHFR